MYHIPPHLNGYGDIEPSFQPIGLAVPPIEGYGQYHGMGSLAAFGTPPLAPPVVQAAPPPPPSGSNIEGSGQPIKIDIDAGTKFVLVGLAGLLFAGLGWMFYKEIKLKEEIVKSGGGKALAEYELAKAAGTAAGSIGQLWGGQAKPNRRRGRRRSRR